MSKVIDLISSSDDEELKIISPQRPTSTNSSKFHALVARLRTGQNTLSEKELKQLIMSIVLDKHINKALIQQTSLVPLFQTMATHHSKKIRKYASKFVERWSSGLYVAKSTLSSSSSSSSSNKRSLVDVPVVEELMPVTSSVSVAQTSASDRTSKPKRSISQRKCLRTSASVSLENFCTT